MLSGKDLASSVEGKITVKEGKGENDDEYTVDQKDMMVLVVVPELNQVDTAFEFEYGLVDSILADNPDAFNTAADEWYWRFYNEHFTDEEGEKLFVIVCTCLGLLICLFCCCICYCSYYCCCKPKVYEDPDVPGRRFSRRKSSRGDSFAASMRRSMRLESIVSRSGQSFRQASMKRPTSVLSGQSPPRPARIIKLDKNDE